VMAEKNPDAAALGRLGGRASMAKLSEPERTALATNLANSRWEKHRREQSTRPKIHEVVKKMLEAVATTNKDHVLFVERGVAKFAEAGTPIAELWMIEADTCVGTYGIGAKFTDVLTDYLAT